MIVVRLFGWVLFFFGILLLGHDLFEVMAGKGFHPEDLGTLWNYIRGGEADDARGWVTHAAGDHASSVFAWVLSAWACAAFLVPGYVMTRLGLPRRIQMTYSDARPAIAKVKKSTKR